jgi:hypothetical protein
VRAKSHFFRIAFLNCLRLRKTSELPDLGKMTLKSHLSEWRRCLLPPDTIWSFPGLYRGAFLKATFRPLVAMAGCHAVSQSRY